MANEKARYSDVELEEFRAIIEEKLKVAKQTYRDCPALRIAAKASCLLNSFSPFSFTYAVIIT